MKKLLLLIILLGAIFVGYKLLSPLIVDKEVSESLDEIIASMKDNQVNEEMPGSYTKVNQLRVGKFQGEDFHKGSGTVTLIKIGEERYIRMENDFQVTNGPDLFVHLGKDSSYIKDANLGELKGNIGSQNYKIPDRFSNADFNEVWVWCRAFSVPFASAKLQEI